MRREINLWPFGITLVLVVVTSVIIWTVDLALKNPAELDNTYMSSYQKVDEEINKIQKNQKAFNTLYRVEGIPVRLLRENPAGMMLRILEKESGRGVDNAVVDVRFTRPHTSKDDIEARRMVAHGELTGSYSLQPLDFPKPGRWIVQVRIKVDNLEEAYLQQEFFVEPE